MNELILINGIIYLEDGVFCQGVKAENGIITVLGSNEDVLADTSDAAQIIDLKGKTVVPGFNDAHLHLVQKAVNSILFDCSNITSLIELITQGREFIRKNPILCSNGLLAIGFNQDKFTDEKRIPDRNDLDRISTEIPLVFTRVCGHIVCCNSKAIEMLGLTRYPCQPENGTILLDEEGYPNGIFTEQYGEKVEELIPAFTFEQIEKVFSDCLDYAASKGLTSVQSNDVGQCTLSMDDVFRLIKQVYEKKKHTIRYHHQVCVKNIEELQYFLDGEYRNQQYQHSQMLTMGPLKLFKDGSLGGRTALLRNGYADDRDNYGVMTISDEKFDELCQKAKKNNLQVITHVIGDGAIERVVSSYEKINCGNNDLRNALVHCQITDRNLLERIKKNNLSVIYQPVFLDYDMHIVEKRCGRELAETSYAFNTARKMGINIAYSTDCPVEDLNPLVNIYHAVSRMDKKGYPENGFCPDEKVTVAQAVDAYTIGSAYIQHMENIKGRIKEGYLADMTVIDKNIFASDASQILESSVVYTIVSGEIIYQKAE